MDVHLPRKALISGVLLMGLGHILFLKQRIKGVLYMLSAFIVLCLIAFERTASGLKFNFNGVLIRGVRGFVTLGIFDPALPIKDRDHSIFLMIDGLICIIVLLLLAVLYALSIRGILKAARYYINTGGDLPEENKISLHSLMDRAFHSVGLAPVFILLSFFILLPMLFSFCLAFTNYSYPDHIPPANKVDWVGFQNFFDLFGGTHGQGMWTSALGRVLVWTVMWGVLSTACVYFAGMFMAISLQGKHIRHAKYFRAIFILPYAIPATLSLMVWSNLLNGTFGPLNAILMDWGLIGRNIPWLTETVYARASMIMVYTWTGFPYHMLMVTSIMTSISSDIYEAASIDGASRWQQTQKITIPLVMVQTAPLVIMSFTYNINNFGAAFFLFMGAGSTGGPSAPDTVSTNANSIDIVVTWIYKLTMNNPQKFQYASVLAILVFVVLTPFAIWNYMRTKSYKESDY